MVFVCNRQDVVLQQLDLEFVRAATWNLDADARARHSLQATYPLKTKFSFPVGGIRTTPVRVSKYECVCVCATKCACCEPVPQHSELD